MGGPRPDLTVGVVTAVYNRALTLADTCRSVQMQDFPHVHIIVDDGSTDGSYGLAQQIQRSDRETVVLRRQRESGDLRTASNAMNVGLRHLLTETDVDLVTRLDSDDILAPHSLRLRAERFDERTGAVFARQGGFTGDRAWSTTDRLRHGGCLTKSEVFRYTLPYHSLMIRTKLLQGVEYASDLDYQEDLDLTLRVLQNATSAGLAFAHVDALTVWTRAHDASISGQINALRAAWMTTRVWRRHRSDLTVMDLWTQLRTVILKYRVWHAMLQRWERLMNGSDSRPRDSHTAPAEVAWFAQPDEEQRAR